MNITPSRKSETVFLIFIAIVLASTAVSQEKRFRIEQEKPLNIGGQDNGLNHMPPQTKIIVGPLQCVLVDAKVSRKAEITAWVVPIPSDLHIESDKLSRLNVNITFDVLSTIPLLITVDTSRLFLEVDGEKIGPLSGVAGYGAQVNNLNQDRIWASVDMEKFERIAKAKRVVIKYAGVVAELKEKEIGALLEMYEALIAMRQ